MQEVLDDGVEPVRVGRDVGDHRCPDALVELRAACLQQPRVAVDRGHRRPQLVRDEPEEGVLDRVGGLERTGGTLPVGDVDQDVDRADQLPVIREQGRRVGGERHLAAVGPDRDRLAAANGSGLVEGDRHRALVVTHRRIVGPEQSERSAPQLAERGLATPEFRGSDVEEGDPPVGVGRVDRHAEGIEEAPVSVGPLMDRSRCGRPRARRTAGDDPEQMPVELRCVGRQSPVGGCRMFGLQGDGLRDGCSVSPV